MKTFFNWLKENILFIIVLLFGAGVLIANTMLYENKPNPVLKEYKDGIQNRLIWNIKGECYFVRPNDDVTVYLVRVQDCDRK